MKHTKEPWRVVSDVPVMAIYSEPEDYRVVQTVNQNNFNTYGKSRVDVGIYKQEDAERIVACVNACADAEDEKLTMGYVKKLQEENERLNNLVMMQNYTIAKLSEQQSGVVTGMIVPELEDV